MFNELWNDEAGFIVSAETVLVGTVAVVGATVGLNALATSVNEELTDVAMSIRSLDQSYSYKGFEGCGASTAGSSFKQQDVKVSLKELDKQIEKEERELEKLERKQREALKKKQKDQEKKKKRKLRDEAV